jgi:hypothetical protein
MVKPDLSSWGPVTVLLVVITAVAALAGAVICIVHPDTLTFEALLNDLEKFAIGLGLLGVGRGVAAHGRALAASGTPPAAASNVSPTADDTATPPTDTWNGRDEGDAGGLS